MRTVVGLTGPTGAGKSSVTEMAQKKGIKVIDCDLYARMAVIKGSEGLKALTEAFGEDILSENGELNRAALAKLAFSSNEKTELLNQTLLPFIKALVLKEINTEKVLLDAPTLFESGINSVCDKTVAVLASKEQRFARITERDNISQDAALLRISAGKSDEFFRENADIIIYNNGSKDEFLNEACAVLDKIFGGNFDE